MNKTKFPEKEAAPYLGLTSTRTLQNWRQQGKGPAYFKVGGKVVYDQRDLDRFLASGRVEPELANV